MLRAISFLLGFLPLAVLANGDKCIQYTPETVIKGTLERHVFPGRPNYESIAKGDEAEAGLYLRLPHPVCTTGDPASSDAYPQKNVKRVQLVLRPPQYDELRPSLGKPVSVTGELFARHTAHHHAPLLIVVKSHGNSPP